MLEVKIASKTQRTSEDEARFQGCLEILAETMGHADRREPLRAWCGILGKQDSCQIAVTVSMANSTMSVLATYRPTCRTIGPLCQALGTPTPTR